MNSKSEDPHHVILDGQSLTIEDIVRVARRDKADQFAHVQLADEAIAKINRCRAWVQQAVADGRIIYGVTTGFGSLKRQHILPHQVAELQRNLILSHASGVGDPLDEEIVRAAILIRANTLAKGCSGIRVEVLNLLVELLNRCVHPVIPAKGSVGASGDLAPLSHLALVLIGVDEAETAVYQGVKMSARAALQAAGLQPVVLEAKEGLALNNGATVSAATMCLALYDAENLIRHSEIALAMTLEAVKGCKLAFQQNLHDARRHLGQATTARNVRRLTKGSLLLHKEGADQDAYSIRCAPQVIGAARDVTQFVRDKLAIEINSATDNPLILPKEEDPSDFEAIGGGNFHGEPVAFAADFLGIALAEVGNIAERRVFRLASETLSNGLPCMLVHGSGLNNGFMIPQYTAAALVSENKTLAHPDSVDSIPTCEDQEDHVSMSANAARHAREIVWNVRQILAIEMMCAAQGLEFRQEKGTDGGKDIPIQRGIGTQAAYDYLRKNGPDKLQNDRFLAPDIKSIADIIHTGHIVSAVEEAIETAL